VGALHQGRNAKLRIYSSEQGGLLKILWVKAGRLLPLDTGGRSRSYNILRNLSAHHELTLLSYYGGRRDEEYETEIVRQLPGAITLYVPHLDGGVLNTFLHYVRHLPSRLPYAVSKFTARKIQGNVSHWLRQGRFDLAVCDFLSASCNFPITSTTPLILFQHNVESELWSRLAAKEANWIRRLIYRLEAVRMSRYEPVVVRRFDHIIAVSERDRERMATMTDSSRITILPTGVDLSQYRSAEPSSGGRPLVVFTGSMDWEPNIDGVEYFCRDIWPLIREKVPSAQFRIVGRNPHSRVKRLGHGRNSVLVTGTVSSVIDHLREATVIIVPLRIGGGTRLKIYEAMAMGKAVVSTTVGAEGLDVQQGKDILLVDDPATFSGSVVALLTDESLRKRIGRAAADKAAEYDWSRIALRCERILRRAADMRHTSPALPTGV
jgi:glycosyltransferase involved in cell wall biosynthesis